MYVPEHFAEPDTDTLHALIRAYPLATLIVHDTNGLSANHIPLHLESPSKPHGKLTGHIPRANPLSAYSDTTEALAVFHGPSAYITPNWYPTKREHGKAVPTWNYAVAHVYGKLRIIDDPEWVKSQVESMTDKQEGQFTHPWQVSDAPEAYVAQLLRALVGIEIAITRLIGKVKASQNQPAMNRAGVVEGLKSTGHEEDTQMADLMSRVEPDAG